MKTLLIGLDAACPSVLEPLVAAGEVETLGSLWESGVGGPLESQVPPWTASAWPSLYTGTNPGKHGVFGFLDFEGYDWSVVNATHVRTRPVWEHLDLHGLSSVVVNVPVTHPPAPFDGALIPGYAAPEDPACHPDGLLADVRAAVGDYRIYAPADVEGEEEVGWFRRLTRMRGEAFVHLADEYDPDFGFLQFQQTDTVFHERPDDPDAVRAVYREVDEQVSNVLDACEPDTVIVASDHGIGPCAGPAFHANDYLAERGYLSTERGGGGMPSWVTVREERLRAGEAGGDADLGRLAGFVAAAARVGLTAERVAGVLDALGLAEFVAEHVPGSVQRAGTRQVDFPASAAFVRDAVELGVRINVAGREPDGVVPESDYEALREELIEALSAAETPDGEPVFDDVAPREAYFHGPAAEDAVDVVTVPAGFDVTLSSQLRGEPFGPPTEPIQHKLEGVVVADGAAVDPDRPVGAAGTPGAGILDVAPTVLASLGVPVDSGMDGDPLPFVEAVGERSYPRPSRRRAVPTEAPEVEDRLRELGYVEE